MELKISEVLAKYDTDKVREHSYGYAYDDIFSRFNRHDSLNVLEVGIQKGQSLLAWKEYFPNAKITGVDIVDQVENKNDSISYVIQDIKEFKTEDTFDIVIDDGSHWLKDVVPTLAYFSQKLNPKGVIIVEDVQAPEFWAKVFNNILSSAFSYNKGKKFVIECYDFRETPKRMDDFIMAIYEKDSI